ncbi:MAG: hypothetical protein RLZZ500_842 [Bacteroidota bacterium]|jgi:hypothetical protein
MNRYKELLLGCLAGLGTAALGITLVLFFMTDFSHHYNLRVIKAEGILGKTITLGTLLNLATFFWFLNKRKDFWAYGVLIATCLLTLLTLFV